MTLILTIPVVCLTLVLMLRGGEFHNYLVAEADGILQQAGFQTAQEYPQNLPGGGKDFIDLVAGRGKSLICIEVETSVRNILSNVIKAHQLNLPLIILVPNATVRTAVKRKLSGCQLRPGGKDICILLLAQLKQEVTNYFHLISSANGAGENKKTNQKKGKTSCESDGNESSA